ncbi:MAG: citramalate synthase [Planctomycetaceae bacterium]|nr:citramalate synthase [Planctomycetaceae bacterium]
MVKIQFYDTTLRDGSQAEGINFSLQDKIALAQRLDALGFDFVEGGYPASNEKDTQFFQEIGKKTLISTKISAFGMTRRRGTKAADDAGLQSLILANTPYITIVGKSSAFQAVEIIRASREENLEMIRDTVAFFVANGRKVIFDAEHFFDGWKDDAEYSLATLTAAVEAGAELVALCDTNGGSMPDEIGEAVRQAVAAVNARGGNAGIGIHTHNDCGLAVANAIAAVDAGATHVQGTINGFGERCGNADLIQIAAILVLKKTGYDVLRPDSIAQLTDLARFVYEMVNVPISKRQPFVGKSAFAHKGGMHVSGIHRSSNAYEHIDPERVGNERRVLVSELSGRSNIVALTEKHKIAQDAKLQQAILAEVVIRESKGYQYELAEGSFNILVKRLAGNFKPHFEKLHYRVNIESDDVGAMLSEATVKIRVDDNIRHEVAEGDGPVDALNLAMHKALDPFYPSLAEVRLIDYKVRVIDSDAGTGAQVRVVIESTDGHDTWGTVGVSENIVEASWEAIADSFEYKLNR